jgi:hypothetical protein
MTRTKWLVESKAVILTILMAASTAMNVFLSLECAHLRGMVRDSRPPQPIPNARVLSFTAKNIDGSPRSFVFPREKMLLLYAFSPSCVYSRRNHPNAVSLSQKLGTRADFVAVSLMDNRTLLETYLAGHRCPFPVLFGVAAALKKDLRMGITPQLFVLSSSGELLKVWSGAFADENREEIEAFLHVKI